MTDAEMMLADAKRRLENLSIFASKNTRKKLRKEVRRWEWEVEMERTPSPSADALD